MKELLQLDSICQSYAQMTRVQFFDSQCSVVWQRTEEMVESIIWVLLEIYFSFQQWKNFENSLMIDKVVAMSLVYYFFGTQWLMSYNIKGKVSGCCLL